MRLLWLRLMALILCFVASACLSAATPTITTGVATNVTDLKATLNGTGNANGGGGINVYFDFGLNTNYGNTIVPTPSVMSGSNTRTFTAALSGLLQPSTTYHYRIYAVVGGAYFYGSDASFTTGAASTPPTIGSVSSDSVTASKASLRAGNIFAGSSPATVTFQYGFSTAYGTSVNYSVLYAGSSTDASIDLTGLTPGSAYHFRCVVSNSEGVASSSDATFTTRAAPVLVTLPATNVTDLAATLHGLANPSGGSLNVSFDYGTTMNYGSTLYPSNQAISGSNTVAMVGNPTDLLPGTTYHCRIKGYDSGGTYYYGTDATFVMAQAATPPTVGSASASAVLAASATLTASTITTGSSSSSLIFEYGPTSAYGMQAAYSFPLSINSSYGSILVSIAGLAPGTLYHFRARTTNSEGSVVTTDGNFTTLSAPGLSTIEASGVTDLAATLNGAANANSGSYTAAFEYGVTASYGSSVSATPSSINGSTLNAMMAKPPYLAPSTTYHYRLKVDDGITSFYGSDASFTTLAAASPPAINTLPASGVTATTASLNATLANTGSSSANVVFNYGLTADYGQSVAVVTLPQNHPYGTVSAVVSNLQRNTTYHFSPVASNAEGTTAGIDQTFTTTDVPSLVTGAASSVSDLSATLNAVVNVRGVSSIASFEYGLSTSYGSVVAVYPPSVSGSSDTSISVFPSGLTPMTLYHFRPKVVNVDGFFYGADSTFTTGAAHTPPSIGQVISTSAYTDRAYIDLSSTQAGSSTATIGVDYGPTRSYGFHSTYSSPLVAGTTIFPTIAVTGLSPGTLYHFSVVITNAEGSSATSDSTFVTKSIPSVTTGSATSVTDIGAVLHGTINGGTTYATFQYGTTAGYGFTASANLTYPPGSITGSATATLTGLTPNTTYHYRFKCDDGSGTNTTYGADMTFTTQSASSLPAVITGTATPTATGSVLTATNIAAGGYAAVVSWQYGIDTSYGASATYNSPIPVGQIYGTASSSISGLIPSTTYHYRAVISDGHATIYGGDATFITPAPQISATTQPATQINMSGAVLNGTYFNNATGSTLYFDYGLDTNYGLRVDGAPAVALESNSSQNVSGTITGLTDGAFYHYRIVIASPYGAAYGNDQIFTTTSSRFPVAVTGTATGSTTGNAVFRGTINGHGYPTTAIVEYGLTSNYGNVIGGLPGPLTTNLDALISATASGLTPNAVYHYRVDATNAYGTAYGADATVQMVQPPIILAASVSAGVGGSNARFQGQITVNGPANGYFEYGTSLSYGDSLSFGTSGNGYPIVVTAPSGLAWDYPQLLPGTTYHFRLVAWNAGGTVFGDDTIFTTDFSMGSITAREVTSLSPASAILNANIDETGGTDKVVFNYGLTTDWGTIVPAEPATVSGIGSFPVSAKLTGLIPGATYHYTVTISRSSPGYSSSVSSGDHTFVAPYPMDVWRQQYFNTNSNGGIYADDGNPTGDGICNLMKYALGLDPTMPSGPLPSAVLKTYGAANYLSYTFSRNPANVDITYEVLTAGTLDGPWVPVATSIGGGLTTGVGVIAETPNSDGTVSVEVRDTISAASADRRFLRLRITR